MFVRSLALFVQIAFIYLFGNVHSNKNTWLGKALLPYRRNKNIYKRQEQGTTTTNKNKRRPKNWMCLYLIFVSNRTRFRCWRTRRKSTQYRDIRYSNTNWHIEHENEDRRAANILILTPIFFFNIYLALANERMNGKNTTTTKNVSPNNKHERTCEHIKS